jgi:hypothetical protein
VLVSRYLNLVRAGVDPSNILAITFKRKAAAEMRERIVRGLKQAASESPAGAARWRQLQGRLGDIAISTIDAFCVSLLREFPLEPTSDPGFLDCRRDEAAAPRHEARGSRSASAGPGFGGEVWPCCSRRSASAQLQRARHLLDRRLVARSALARISCGRPGGHPVALGRLDDMSARRSPAGRPGRVHRRRAHQPAGFRVLVPPRAVRVRAPACA